MRRLASDVAFRRFMISYARYRAGLEAKNPNFDPNQPRWPKDTPGGVGGRWSGGSLAEPGPGGRRKDDPDAKDVGSGHHIVSQSVFKSYPFSQEALQVFRTSVTGPLPPGLNQFDQAHRDYNAAIRERMDRFLAQHTIRPEAMTTREARQFVLHVVHARDHRIHSFLRRLHIGSGQTRPWWAPGRSE